jgi:hypothetical protein
MGGKPGMNGGSFGNPTSGWERENRHALEGEDGVVNEGEGKAEEKKEEEGKEEDDDDEDDDDVLLPVSFPLVIVCA